jgi:DNA mismatch endonuclease (patch repair protein)
MIVKTDIDPKRSANMARIGPRNTAPEMAVRRLLHRMGYRFRIHRTDLPGTPDVVLPRHGVIFLIHGCFWHRHPGCRFAYTPKSRTEFWAKKFEGNVARDEKVRVELVKAGWRVCVIWECETKDLALLGRRLRKTLGRRGTAR